MKKTLITLGIAVGVIATPILGMTISPTRDAILGLAPDQAVLSLADKIDEQRVSTEQTDAKIQELQSVIDNQQSEIANYQKQVEIVKEETEHKISNESECRKLYSDNPECTVGNKIYRNKSNFNEFIKGEHIRPSDINDYKKMYDICQKIISNCD